jgi:ketosteroid isomerase-like protein
MSDQNATNQQEVLELGQRWAEAEGRSDADALAPLLTDDFVAVGPLGFVLDRAQYLGGRRSGELKIEGFAWEPGPARVHGDAAVVVGVATQRAVYRGQPQPVASGRFRVSQVAVRQGGAWRLAGLQYSGPIPDAPPGQGARA